MFYKKPIVIDRVAHRHSRFQFLAKAYSYASKSNSIPVTTVEFGVACLEYPIVFILDDNGSGIPVALTGLREDENIFVNAEGNWDANYVPAFVRRYPFILQSNPDNTEFNVLIDSEADGFEAESGERLFNDDGSNSPLLSNVIELLEQFRVYADHTAEFVKELRQLDLLMPRVVNATTHDGENFQMNGFSVVDEARLNALSDADLLKISRNDYLAGIHSHLISLSNIQRLMSRFEKAKQI